MKGQITIFILIGVVLVMSLGMFLIVKQDTKLEADSQIDTTMNYSKNLFERQCLEQEVKNNLRFMYAQGGFFLMPDFYVEENFSRVYDTHIPYYDETLPDLKYELEMAALVACDTCSCANIPRVIATKSKILFKFDELSVPVNDNIFELFETAKNISKSTEICLTCNNLSFENYEGKATIFDLEGLRFAVRR